MTYFRSCLILFLLTLVSACAQNSMSRAMPACKTAQVTVINHERRCFCVSSIEQLQDQLAQDGVQVIQLGDEIMLLIPSRSLFYGQSPRVMWRSYGILNHVADYLSKFPKIAVRVAGYTDNCGTELRNLALSRARAQNVVKYLWSQDVDARLIYAKGFGSADPITSNNKINGQQQNDRIEITFRQLSSIEA